MSRQSRDTESVVEAPALTLPARTLALGWLNAFSAAGSDENRPALNRTLSLEWFPDGLQMIATDGTVLVRTWAGAGGAAWRETDEAPAHATVIMDAEGFGSAFMKALLKLTSDEAHAFDTVAITTQPSDEGATLALGDEFMRERLIVRVAGQRLDLPLYEGRYPDWRGLDLGLDQRERVPGLLFGTRVLGTVAKLKGCDRVDLTFHGTERAIGFVAEGVDTEARGLMMPMRRMDPEA